MMFASRLGFLLPPCIFTPFFIHIMELDFRKNPAILSNMLDVMADGVFTVDAKGHIVAWSTGAARTPVIPVLMSLGNPATF